MRSALALLALSTAVLRDGPLPRCAAEEEAEEDGALQFDIAHIEVERTVRSAVQSARARLAMPTRHEKQRKEQWEAAAESIRKRTRPVLRAAYETYAEDPDVVARAEAARRGNPLLALESRVRNATSSDPSAFEDRLDEALQTIAFVKAIRINEAFEGTEDAADVEAPVSFGLTTQLSWERAWMLSHVCMRWHSQIFAAVYVPAEDEEEYRRDVAPHVGARCDRENLHIVEYVDRDAGAEQYPVNKLRNLAMAEATTSHVLVVDIDHWPSFGLSEALERMAVAHRQLFASARSAVVIPTFEHADLSYCSGKADDGPDAVEACLRDAANKRCPGSFEELELCYSEGSCRMYHSHFPHSHNSTRYDLLWHVGADAMRRLHCLDSEHYEPYVVVKRSGALPKFDEAFVGYGLNKISWFWALHRLGWQLYVGPRVFLFHVKHSASRARTSFRSAVHKKANAKSRHHEIIYRYAAMLLQAYDFAFTAADAVTPLCAAAEKLPRAERPAPTGKPDDEMTAIVSVFLGER